MSFALHVHGSARAFLHPVQPARVVEGSVKASAHILHLRSVSTISRASAPFQARQHLSRASAPESAVDLEPWTTSEPAEPARSYPRASAPWAVMSPSTTSNLVFFFSHKSCQEVPRTVPRAQPFPRSRFLAVVGISIGCGISNVSHSHIRSASFQRRPGSERVDCSKRVISRSSALCCQAPSARQFLVVRQ